MDLDFLTHAPFWIALGQIIIIDILLGGDNAVVIALACRKLPAAQRSKGIIYGTAGAIVLRVVLIMFAMTLLKLPFLKVVGALLLVWIGIKLLAPDEEGHEQRRRQRQAAGRHQDHHRRRPGDERGQRDRHCRRRATAQARIPLLLVSLGLLISIPIIVWGTQLVIKLMERFPDDHRRRHAAGLDRRRACWSATLAFVDPEQWLWLPKLGQWDSNGWPDLPSPVYWRPISAAPCWCWAQASGWIAQKGSRRATHSAHAGCYGPIAAPNGCSALRRCCAWPMSTAASRCTPEQPWWAALILGCSTP